LELTSEPDSPGLGHGAPVQAAKNPGNDAAVKCKVWQAWSPKRKLNFVCATLAELSVLIKDDISRWLRLSYVQSRQQRWCTEFAGEEPNGRADQD
jgi:hypothetical protein